MSDYHRGGRAVDFTVSERVGGLIRDLAAELIKLREQSQPLIAFAGTFRGTHIYTRGSAMFFVPARPRKPKTHAADRTRSKRRRAGSKRTKKAARLARRRRTPASRGAGWSGWTEMGWTTEAAMSDRWGGQ